MTNILLKNVYVVNLERSKDRLQHIDDNLKKFGIKYQRFNAVDGGKLPMSEIDNNTTLMCRYLFCTRSIIGCAMSHIALWKMIAESPDKWHLILEDDAEFTNETIKFLNELSNTTMIKNEDNIIISLVCTSLLCGGPSVACTSAIDGNKKNNVISETKHDLLIEPVFPLSTAGYLITKNTAKKLYDYFMENKINYHIDTQISWLVSKLGIKFYTAKNKIINLSTDSCSTTVGSGYKPLYLLNKIIQYFNLCSMSSMLECPYATFNLSSVKITGYVLIFLLLLLLNVLFFGSVIIYIYLILELSITIILTLLI